MGLIMTVTYLAGFHQPQPHHMPVAVVGEGTQVTAFAEKIQRGLGDMADVQLMASPALAEQALKRTEIVGAYVPGKDSAVLMTAPAASETSANVAVKMFNAVSEKAQLPMHIQEVVPLAKHDSAGQNSFFYLIALTVSAYALGLAVAVAGASYSMLRRVVIVAGLTLTVVTIEFLIARFAMHMFEGHSWQLWGLSLLYVGTVMSLCMGLHSLFGRWSGMAFSAIFVALNFTSSGGVFESWLQPAFFGWLHNFWIGSGFIQAARQILYFPSVDASNGYAILLGWFLLALLVLWMAATWEKVRAVRTHTPRHFDLSDEQEAELEEDVAVA